jgi:peptide/nickel transport system substrate-binding protein
MGEIPPVDAARLDTAPEFDLITVPVPGLSLQFYMNTARAPTDDLRVRQALLYAVDQQLIVDIVFLGFSPPAYGPLTRSTWAYTSDIESMYPSDPDRARALLQDAGWVDDDGDGIRERDGERLVLEVILTSWGFVPEVGQVLEQQLEAVGVDLDTIVIAAYPILVETAAAGEYHLIPFTLSSHDPHILRSMFHSSNIDGGFNWSKVQNDELDSLLDTGMRTMDRAQRAAIYAEAQERIMQQALIVPIRDYVNLNGASADVQNLQFDAQGWFPWLYDVEIE